jgi:hypothetical protein
MEKIVADLDFMGVCNAVGTSAAQPAQPLNTSGTAVTVKVTHYQLFRRVSLYSGRYHTLRLTSAAAPGTAPRAAKVHFRA